MPTAPALDVALLGEMMVLLVADRPGPLEDAQGFLKRTAGAETNVAIGLARLGLRVGWASRLGEDSFGRWLLAQMRAEGVDCTQVAAVPGARTGFMLKGRVEGGGDPPIEYHRAGSAASRMGPADLPPGWPVPARHLHATGVFPAISASALACQQEAVRRQRAAGGTVSFDPNLRPSLWPSIEAMRAGINALAAQADWVLPGLEEGRVLTGEATPEGIARWYRARGAALVVVKLGPEGAWFDSATAGCGRVPGVPVDRVVDTVGAGDAFAVGVVSGLLDGLAVPQAVARGCALGARAVQVLGDTEGLPTRAQLGAGA
jgi:2-dehydro-3-deoxygluconokinase